MQLLGRLHLMLLFHSCCFVRNIATPNFLPPRSLVSTLFFTADKCFSIFLIATTFSWGNHPREFGLDYYLGLSLNSIYVMFEDLKDDCNVFDELAAMRKDLVPWNKNISCHARSVVKNAKLQSLGVVTLVYLYLRPNEASLLRDCSKKESSDTNPLVQAHALRAMTGIHLHVVAHLVLAATMKYTSKVFVKIIVLGWKTLGNQFAIIEGAAYVHLSTCVPAIKDKLEDADERLVAAIIQKALVAPTSLIARNAGVEGEVVVEKVKESKWEVGYNAMSDKCENLVEAGVIDPAKVTRCALHNAASVAGMVLTTQAIVVEKPKPKALLQDIAIHDGTKIAVKRMESGIMGSKGLTEFKSEMAVLNKVRHRNLVSRLGYCLYGNERLLVYEYMPQGTLSRHICDWKEKGLKPLEWKKRLSIALDVARGVEYLHSLAHQSYIHRDLKPSNILLGDDKAGVVGILHRALEDMTLLFDDGNMTQTLKDVSSTQPHQLVQPLIFSCFGNIALAIGGRFERYLCYSMSMPQSAAKISG